MYVLERAGIECHHVDRSGVDLWCQSNNNDMFTLQVKAANPSKIAEGRSLTRYYYNLRTPKVADFYMFVALDIEKVIIMSVNK
jgi:DNA-binding protein Fis